MTMRYLICDKCLGAKCDPHRCVIVGEVGKMTNEEMQVLRALEVGLEMAEESYEYGVTNTSTKLALARVQQIMAAIEVVKRWETKE